MGTPLYNTDIKTVLTRPELSALDAGDFYLIYDTSAGKISRINKTNAHAELEKLANKKSTLAENSEVYYPNQKAVNDGLDTLKGTGWAGQTVKANADDILLRENLANKKSTLVENSEIYYPNQKAVNDGLATKTSKSQIAYDDDTSSFIANTLASGAVIERGSNANGKYVKFADGTLICTGNKESDVFTGEITVELSLPATFTSLPSINISVKMYTTSLIERNIMAIIMSFSIYSCSVRVSNEGSRDRFGIYYIAIGRWK